MRNRVQFLLALFLVFTLGAASANPALRVKVRQFQQLLNEKKQAGIDTAVAERLNEQSRSAGQQGNVVEAGRLLDQAIASLEGTPNAGVPTQSPASESQQKPGLKQKGPQPQVLLIKFQELLKSAKAAGKETARAEQLEKESREAAKSNDRPRAQQLLQEAVSLLGGNSGESARPMNPHKERKDQAGHPGKSRTGRQGPTEWARGAMPVFVLPFSHHYEGPGGYYARPQEIRKLAEFFHSQKVPGTLFFDGILVNLLKKEDPGIFSLINSYGLPLGYHGEETHGPYPVPSDLFAEIYPLKEAQGFQGTWSFTSGKDWNTAVKMVMDRYSHGIEAVIDEKTRKLDRRKEVTESLPRVGGLKLVQEAFGRDISFMPSHGLENAPEGFAFRKMSRFGLDQPAVPIALHALKIFGVSQVADQVMAIAGKEVSLFWYMGRLNTKGDKAGESSWTPKTLEDIQHLDRSQPRLLLMGFSKFNESGAAETVSGMNEFFAANPGSDWVTGESILEKFEEEKAFRPTKSDLGKISEYLRNNWNSRPPDMVITNDRVFSLCDSFEGLCLAFAAFGKTGTLPSDVTLGNLYGPIAESGAPVLQKKLTLTTDDLVAAAEAALEAMGKDGDRFVPARLKIKGTELNCSEFLLALALGFPALEKGEKEQVEVEPAKLFPPYADLLQQVFKPKTIQPLCYTQCQLWTVKPARVKAALLSMKKGADSPKTQPGNSLSGPSGHSKGEIQVVLSANLDSAGGCYREDPSGADLYLGIFDLTTRKISSCRRLTSNPGGAEWFPSISADGEWVAYNRSVSAEGKGRVSNEIRVIHINSGVDTLLIEGGRFPCFTPNGKSLVYSMQANGASRICISEFQPGNGGAATLGQARVVADERHGAERVEDPSVFSDGKRMAFHRKDNPRQGSGGAVINLDGTGFQELTPSAGFGHAAANPDGKTVSISISRDGGLQAVQENDGKWSLPTDLLLSNNPGEFEACDERWKQVAAIAHTYTEWVSPDLLLVSSQGSDGAGHFSSSRVLLFQFQKFGEKPLLIDLSSAMEKFFGKHGKDFCTASGRLL